MSGFRTASSRYLIEDGCITRLSEIPIGASRGGRAGIMVRGDELAAISDIVVGRSVEFRLVGVEGRFVTTAVTEVLP
jgi:hypothetical protein